MAAVCRNASGTGRRPPAPDVGPPVTRIRSKEALLDAVQHDVFVRCEIPDDPPVLAWVSGGSAVMVRRRHTGQRGLAAVGAADDLVRLLRHVTDGPDRCLLAGLHSVTLPRSVWETVAPHLAVRPGGGTWDWMWTDREPDQPPDPRLVELDDTGDAAALQALNARDSPTAESEPGSGRTEVWLGVRTPDGTIAAAGALHRTAAGAPHLAGVVVAREHRGQGLGAAVTAGLTRAALVADGPVTGVCTLGMYAGNDTARRLYRRLGYRTAQSFTSSAVDPF